MLGVALPFGFATPTFIIEPNKNKCKLPFAENREGELCIWHSRHLEELREETLDIKR